jgi:hypothetical protein
MTREDVLQWLRREPFEPFQIHTSGGRVFEVLHPEYAALGETTMVVYFTGSNRWAEISLFQIDSIEKLAAGVSDAAQAQAN